MSEKTVLKDKKVAASVLAQVLEAYGVDDVATRLGVEPAELTALVGETLAGLVHKRGIEAIAEQLGMSARNVRDICRGHTALTVDDLYQLDKCNHGFDMRTTVREIGALRVSKGRDRKSRWDPSTAT